MGLIIKNQIRKMFVGYPTVSDKYNVAGGTLDGTASVDFGDLVGYSSTKGYFKKLTSVSSAADAAGFVVATNVKLADYPSGDVNVKPGEAFNLLVNGFIAVKLASTAVVANIAANKKVAVNATGGITTSGVSSTYDLPNVVFTGVYENIGTSASPVYVAEIYVK